MNLVVDVNTFLKDQKLIRNDYEYSVGWLDKSERYFSMQKATDRDFPVDVKIAVASKLIEKSKSVDIDMAKLLLDYSDKLLFESIPDTVKTYIVETA